MKPRPTPLEQALTALESLRDRCQLADSLNLTPKEVGASSDYATVRMLLDNLTSEGAAK
jgi:hypothetical protein